MVSPASLLHAQTVAYKGGSGARPLIDRAANGRPLIQIVAPNAAGLSHNRYDQFNVDSPGTILNNSTAVIATQLGGYIDGNPHLAAGKSAGVILNEVMGTRPGHLGGPIEVAGQRADVIIANPNGLSVGNGAGFINTGRATLTTGTPLISGQGQLDALQVSRGQITIGPGGLNASATEQLDLIARSVQVNDSLWASRLTILTGSNQAGYSHAGVQIISGEGGQPTVGIDTALLGGMYARQITLTGTEAGVGVRSLGTISAAGGDIQIDSHGKISLQGQTTASGDIRLRSDSDIHHTGVLHAQHNLSLSSAGQFSNSGTLAALNDLTARAAQISSTGLTAAGLGSNGQMMDTGTLTLTAAGNLTATGQNSAAGNIIMTGRDIDLSHAVTGAGGTASLTATGQLTNDHGQLSAGQLDLHAGSLTNREGSLIQTGSDSGRTDITGTLDNTRGTIATNGSELTLSPQQLINTGGTIHHTGTGQLAITAGEGKTAIDNSGGTIATNGRLTLNAAGIDNRAGQLSARQNAAITVTGQIDNTRGRLQSGGAMTIQTGILDNRAGHILSYHEDGLRIDARDGIINAPGEDDSSREGSTDTGSTDTGGTGSTGQGGLIGSNGDITLNAGSLTNSGTVTAANRLDGTITHTLTNSGTLTAGEAGLRAGTLNNNRGTIVSNGNLSLRAGDDIDNTHGTLYSRQQLQLTAGRDITNRDGVIQSEGTLAATAGRDITNTAGRIAGNRTGSIRLHSDHAITNDAGTIGGRGQVSLITATLSNTGQGQIIAGGDLTLETATHLDNRQGSLSAGGNLSLHRQDATVTNTGGTIIAAGNIDIHAARIDNTRGQISSAAEVSGSTDTINPGSPPQTGTGDSAGSAAGTGHITLQADSHLTNTGGLIGSRNDLTLHTGTVTGEGIILAGNNADIVLRGNYTNSAATLFSANNILRFSVTGHLVNNGTFSAQNALILHAAGLTNTEDALINSGQTTVTAQDSLTNRGRIYGDLLALGAGTLLNDAGAVIAARSSLHLGAQQIINRDHGLITSLGNIHVGGALDSQHQATGNAHTVTNTRATIDSGADILINTGTLDNLNPTFQTETVITDTRDVVEYAFNTPTGPGEWRSGTLTRCDNGSLDGLACLGNNGHYWILHIPGYSSNDFWQRIYTQVTWQDRVVATDPAAIYASGNLILNAGRVNNQASAIVSRLGLGGSGDHFSNDTPRGQTTYIRTGIPVNTGQTLRPGMAHHDSDNKKDRWSGFARIDDHIPGEAISFSIWPGDVPPARLDNPARGNGAGTHTVPGGQTGELGHPGDGTVPSLPGPAGEPAAVEGSTPLLTPAERTVARPGEAIPGLTLPDSRLFQISHRPEQTFLIETDPAFTGYTRFLSSDYLLSRLSLNPQTIQKRLGDGYYEQKLINDQLIQLTGKRFTGNYTGAEQQYQALMTAGANYALQAGLVPGMALSEAQIAALTTDIVWLVAQSVTLPGGGRTDVLVPVVYLAGDAARPTGALVSGGDVHLAYSGDVSNSGTVQGNNSLTVQAGNISNSGSLGAGTVPGEGQLILSAQNDLVSTGDIHAGQAALLAGHDLRMESTTGTLTTGVASHTGITQLAGISADRLSLQAGHDISLTAVQISTTGDTVIQSGNNLTLGTVEVASAQKGDMGASGHLDTGRREEVGTRIQSGGSLTVTAAQDIHATAAYVNAEGALAVAAGRDITVDAGHRESGMDMELNTTSSGFLSSGRQHVESRQHGTQSVGSTFSGDSVQVVAGNDIQVTGSNIVATKDITVLAGNSLTVTASQDTLAQQYRREETKSGLMGGGGGIGVTLGTREQDDRYQDRSTINNGSLIGSLSGNVTMVATNDLAIKGSDIIAKNDINLAGRNIDISHVQNDVGHAEQHETKQSGFTLSLSSPITNVATSVVQSVQRSNDVDDSRLKNLYLAKAAASVHVNIDDMKSEVKQLAGGSAGSLSVNLSFGSSQSKSTSESHQSAVQGSQINAGGNLNLMATGDANNPGHGNITVTGSQLAATNMSLAAVNDILIQAAQTGATNHSDNKNSGWSAGVGISVGKETGVTYSASGYQGKGNDNGSSTVQVNSELNAANQLTIVSGRDTTLHGAVANAKQITGHIGGNLTVTSLQDTEDYHGKQQNLSGGASFTAGSGAPNANFSASRSKTDADYASVGDQSGFNAGSGGFNVYVGNHTQLNGGIISSTATADKNVLNTASFATTDIVNQKHVDSQANSVGAGTGSAMFEAGKSALSALLANANEHTSESSQTRATVSAGTIEIRNGDTSALNTLNRDATIANNALIHDDIQQIAKETQNRSEAGQVIADIAGQYANKAHEAMFEKESKVYRVVCKQEPCTYDPAIQSDPNRKEDKNQNVVMVEITQEQLQNMSAEERKNLVVATNGIMNDVQRAGELALQNADKTDDIKREKTGNSKPDTILVNSPDSGNALSELMIAGYEKSLSSFFGDSNPVNKLAETKNSVGDGGVLLGHSRGTLVVNNALQVLINQGQTLDETVVQVKGPALSLKTIKETTNEIRTSDDIRQKNFPEYSSYPNDFVSTVTGRSPNGAWIPSFIELPNIVTKPNSAHSCYGTGVIGCKQIEKPYSYDGLNPVDLQELRQKQVDKWLSGGTIYNPVSFIGPVNPLLPSPMYFQKNPVWGVGTPLPVPQLSNDDRVNQIRDLQQQLQNKGQ